MFIIHSKITRHAKRQVQKLRGGKKVEIDPQMNVFFLNSKKQWLKQMKSVSPDNQNLQKKNNNNKNIRLKNAVSDHLQFAR